MISIPGPIPIVIRIPFWICIFIIAMTLSPMQWNQIAIWCLVICFSVIIHELGHALTALYFERPPRIELIAMGGVTYFNPKNLPVWKRFFITLNGPLFGFFLALFSYYFATLSSDNSFAQTFFNQVSSINLVWTLVNLLPILPLDGGQMVTMILEKFWGAQGYRYTCLMSAIFSLLLSLFLFGIKIFLAGALFFLFFFDNLMTFRQKGFFFKEEKALETEHSFEEAKKWYQMGKKTEAIQAFETIRKLHKGKPLADLATYYLAILYDEQGDKKKSCEVLLSMKNRLDDNSLAFLHRLAFEIQDYPLVLDLGGRLFQSAPHQNIALKNSYAAAALNQPIPAIGWLQAAQDQGNHNLLEIIKDQVFDSVRNHPKFQKFILQLTR